MLLLEILDDNYCILEATPQNVQMEIGSGSGAEILDGGGMEHLLWRTCGACHRQGIGLAIKEVLLH